MPEKIQTIRQAFTEQRRDAKARHRDIAGNLGISEGELIAAHAGPGGEPPDACTLHATRLRAEWPQIVESLQALGEVMALTRNASCVHEKTGTYRNATHNGAVGLVLDADIDLRVFYGRWAHGFAVEEHTDKGVQRSLQFFDAAGTAIHKVFLQPQSDAAAYGELVARLADADQSAGMQVCAAPPAEAEAPDDAIDAAAFGGAWAALRDTHEFFGLLKKFGVSRTQGLRLAPAEFASRVAPASAHRLIDEAARGQVSIMVFVGNPGMIQIHTGPVSNIVPAGPWINILDPRFSLHLRADHVASAWVVRKPTVDGVVTSLELFDAQGETIAMFFGERKPGKPELPAWRALVESLTQEAEPCPV
ncbi:hemin-degrading factor [Thauera sinica]|uniref:Hemin-degrading factor n=1 Tax=Thauera sinica TaxID=2665146 RepID=A0ABW1ATR8_9RHOO|nr:ChuX/HutX family heme-like substrate-binding protein [Thauera sp. K11]ATE61906.1 hemin-degrading factor [Thauera sp. K11]